MDVDNTVAEVDIIREMKMDITEKGGITRKTMSQQRELPINRIRRNQLLNHKHQQNQLI